MADEKPVKNAEIKIIQTVRFQNNLQKILFYTLTEWGDRVMVEFYCEIMKQIELLKFFPKINAKNRFLESTETKEYRNIIFKNYPYIVTYSIQENSIRIINIIHEKQNPNRRRQTY
jgi:plasmid stabilization system protein ParE